MIAQSQAATPPEQVVAIRSNSFSSERSFAILSRTSSRWATEIACASSQAMPGVSDSFSNVRIFSTAKPRSRACLMKASRSAWRRP